MDAASTNEFFQNAAILLRHSWFDCKTCTSLDASGNRVQDVDQVASPEQFPRLTVADFSQNYLTKLPARLVTLTRLNVSRNRLTSLEGLQGLVNLRDLDASYNFISVIPDCGSWNLLSTLRLRNNTIQSLNGADSMPKLHTYVSHDFRPGLSQSNIHADSTSQTMRSTTFRLP